MVADQNCSNVCELDSVKIAGGAADSMMVKWFSFQSIDNSGQLVVVEEMKEVPFRIERLYYMYDLGTAPHGFHAHRALQQAIVCLKGRCAIKLDDGKGHVEELLLDDPRKGLFIDHMVWREIYNFSSDCILLVIASKKYDESDYIRDYADFKKMALMS